MKKLSLLCIILLPTILLAKPVSPTIALQVANNFMNVTNTTETPNQKRIPKRMAKMSLNDDSQEQSYYLYQNADGEGYVIIAADDIAQPILGFSENGTIDEMPDNLRWWLSEYNRQIQWAIEQGSVQTEDTKTEWDNLLKSPQTTNATIVVSPLIKTEWSQETYYNAQCPYDSTKKKRCLTGCVATAMAQIMKYWNHPKQGRGLTHIRMILMVSKWQILKIQPINGV